MAFVIESGVGLRHPAAVDGSGHLLTRAVTENEQLESVELGYAFNINTGKISISAESGLLYFKNDEVDPFVITAIALGVGTGTTSDIGELTVIRNPTAGTLISGASAVDMNQNRNTGSSNTLRSTTLAYKGASGNTVTDGDDLAYFFQGTSGRLFATVDIEVTRGGSIALKYQPNLSSGSCSVYAALVGYVKTRVFDPVG